MQHRVRIVAPPGSGGVLHRIIGFIKAYAASRESLMRQRGKIVAPPGPGGVLHRIIGFIKTDAASRHEKPPRL